MSKLSNAEQLLKIILKDPLKWINDAVKERTEEDLFLEFKTLKHFKKETYQIRKIKEIMPKP